MLPEFSPLGAETLTITGVSGVTPEQLARLVLPFSPLEKPKAIVTLSALSATCDLSGVTLPTHYRLRVYLWVMGSAAKYAAQSYNPTPPKKLKSNLWRLVAAETDDQNTLSVTLPAPAKIARLAVTVRGLFDASAPVLPPAP